MSVRKVIPIEQAEWLIADLPSWWENHEPEWEFKEPGSHPVTYLLIDEQHHAASQAQAHRTIRRLETLEAVQHLSQVEVEFEPAAQRLIIHELAIWRAGADGVRVKRSLARRDAFLLRQREQQLEQQMLNGRLSVVSLLEDVRVGDALELAWTLEPRDMLPGLRFTAFFGFAWSLPTGRALFTVHRAGVEPLFFHLHRPEGVGVPREEVTPERLTWQMERPPLFIAEPNAPGGTLPCAMAEISGWSTWGEVAEFVADLWEEALADAGAAIEEEAQRLTAAAPNPAAAIRAAIRFVQQEVRYLAVDFGHGSGMLPNGAGTVLRRRFGDCKDKTVLLVALLRALGFKAWPLLVATGWREAVGRLHPSTAVFNHVIVSFMADGRKLFVDPTLLGQGGSVAEMVAPPYGCGLPIRPGVTAVEMLPPLPPAEFILTEVFQLDPKQRTSSVQQTFRGTAWFADDLRGSLLRQGQTAFFKARGEGLQRQFPALVVNDAAGTVRDDLDENLIELQVEHELPTWGPKGEKPPDMFRYGAHGLFLAIDWIEGPEQRRQPWMLRHPMKAHHRVVVRGRRVQRSKPEKYRFTGPGFRYTCDVTSVRGEVTFDYRWETTQAQVAAKDWSEYCRQRSKAFECAGANVVLKARVTALPVGVIAAVVLLLSGIFAGVREGSFSPSNSGSSGPRPNPVNPVESRKIAGNLSDAHEAARSGDYATAERLVQELRPYYRETFSFQCFDAEVLIRTNQPAGARTAIANARRLQPASVKPDYLEALMEEQLGRFGNARNRYEQILSRQPNDVEVLTALGRVAKAMEDIPAARAAWEKVMAVDPTNGSVLRQHGSLLWTTGDKGQADEAVRKMVREGLAPNASLEMAYGEYFNDTGRPLLALEPFQRAAVLAPTDPRIVHGLVMALIRAGRKAEALDVAQKLVKTQNHPLAWRALSLAAANVGIDGEAVRGFQGWFDLRPGDPDAVACYGYFLRRAGRSAEARPIMARAVREFPGNGLLWLNYAAVLESLGETQAAAEANKNADALLPPSQRSLLVR